jgi:M6 family metalloprotease-like protein
MKKKLFLYLFSVTSLAFCSWLNNIPKKLTEPDGNIINCFASGDEFYNRLHDKEGYTITRGSDGYFYFAEMDGGKIVASNHRYAQKTKRGSFEPAKNLMISEKMYQSIRKKREIHLPPAKANINSLHKGILNNITIFIRFKGENEFATTRGEFSNILNDTSNTAESLYNYYKTISYDKLSIKSHFFPKNSENRILSYEDEQPRGYYEPYNKIMNPMGYTTANKDSRLLKLLANATENIKNQIPSDLNIDLNDDGLVDAITFIIKGQTNSWGDLLWPHAWVQKENIMINDKRVFRYIFTLENMSSVGAFSHEFFHLLGAPDLYHYNSDHVNLYPVGPWDIMDGAPKGTTSHMGSYMKYKYSEKEWISEIPEITENGIYTLNPLSSQKNNCYKIASNKENEFYVVEYRKRNDVFEKSLPGEGLLIYRINDRFYGNAQYNAIDIFDEVYLYRKGGNTPFENGFLELAAYSEENSRTEINFTTSPSPFLTDGSYGGLKISEIGTTSETISFKVEIDKSNTLHKTVDLAQNYPNPFNPNTTIEYSIKYGGNVNIKIFNIKGEEIAELVNTKKAPGIHTITFNGSGLASGHYFYRIKINGESLTKKMMLIR